ncbi:MAG: 4Fe-4S binding protein [Armatimonadetes bacterium]|nr:4Fe-4S binding protein [Armatimonadota bacterium]
MACKTCEIMCAVAHSNSKELFSSMLEDQPPEKRISVEKAENFTVPLQCRHCEDAPCVSICPTKAMIKLGPGQAVILEKEKCIGCKMCILVCPFGVIKLDREGKAIIKCDLCIERLKEGKLPACVSSCPTKTLEFKEIEEFTKNVKEKALEKIISAFQDRKKK